ncbi:MAG: DinB family protein [Gemmatimonadales bacterium]
MPERQPWFERRFTFELSNTLFTNVVERVRGTPARLEERVRGVPTAVLTRRVNETWSIQENAGHLLDLEPLWLTRAEELAAGQRELAAADLQNRKTHEANHNARPLDGLLEAFRQARARFVTRLDAADDALLARHALHPRLHTPMRLIDLALFVAEHDDHHLARISELLKG